MKHKLTYHILPITVVLLLLCCMMGCVERQENLVYRKGDSIPYCVVVVHSFDSSLQCYKEYDKTLSEAFKKDSIDVAIYTAYIDLNGTQEHPYAHQVLDFAENVHADLLITEGNFALYSTLAAARHRQKKPTIVAGGVTVTIHNLLEGYPHLILWKDEPDYARILQMACELTDKNVVETECDDTDIDSVMILDIRRAIQDGPFIDNLDLTHESLFNDSCLLGRYRDSIIVHGIPAMRPDQIRFKDTGKQLYLPQVVRGCSNYPQVMIKYDVYSDIFCNASERPQFTVLPYEFGDDRHLFLAGYFVPMTTEARDVEGTAKHILRGETSMRDMAGRHIRQAYMDWPAMQTYGLRYDDYKDSYNILNVPFHVQHPYMAAMIPWLIVFVVALVIFIILNIVFRLRRRHLRELQSSIDQRQLSLLGDDAYPFSIDEKGLFIIDQQQRQLMQSMLSKDDRKNESRAALPQVTLRSMALKGYGKVIDELYTSILTPGSYHLTLPLSFNNGRNYHWWTLRYMVTLVEEENRNIVNGIMINVDSEKEFEKQLERHRRASAEVRRHENFLRNMSHEIRTPLNSIIGFCEMLCQPDLQMSKEEEQEVRDTITNNATRLNHIVNDVLNYSRMQSGRTVIHQEDIDIDSFMDMFVNKERNKVENHRLIDENGVNKTGLLRLQYHHGRRGMHITADTNLLEMVLKQILSNAIKYTPRGDIHVGYQYDLDTKEVSLYIEDSGKGIKEDQREEIFTLFYKENQFDKGIGLGLSVAQRIAEKMGGRITVSSQLGVGSRFSVIFKTI